MKLFYLAVIGLSGGFFLLLGTVSIATRRDEALAHSLLSHPQTWEITVDKEAAQIDEDTEVKKQLLVFLERSQEPSTYRMMDELSIVSLVVLAFGIIGYLRERRLRKYIRRWVWK